MKRSLARITLLLAAWLLPAVAALARDMPKLATDKYLANIQKRDLAELDANDTLYQVNASRNYDPSATLGSIEATVMRINSADGFINPPELGIAGRAVKTLPHGEFVLIPISDQAYGHGAHT